MKPLVYDIEIIKAIPPKKDADRIEEIEYCEGWHDHKNMGISVIGAYDFETGRSRVFCKDNMEEFLELAQRRMMVGFNSMAFDDAVIGAVYGDAYRPAFSYDILRETWIAAGLGPKFQFPTHIGYSLDAIAKANGLPAKTGNGAFAPVQWQRGEIGAVIDYCMQDVEITRMLFNMLGNGETLISPKTGASLKLADPYSIPVVKAVG